MIRTALIAAALLLGTAAEATPYKITMTGLYYTSYLPGTAKGGTMSFQAIVNDPKVITRIFPFEGPDGPLEEFNSETRIATMFDTKVDGVTASKSFMDLSLSWLTLPNYDQGYFGIHKVLRVDFNSLSIPSMAEIARPQIEEQCQTAYQPYGACTLQGISSEMISYYSDAIGIDTNISVDDKRKDILDFSIGKDANINTCCTFARIDWTAVPPAGYDGEAPSPGSPGTIDFSLASFTISPVPEPASWAILITGFGMVGAVTRRKKRALAHA
ncbi:PEPxxWA-CTERM sorting domain-containing protein [Sphingomonas trueperi]|uniref:PEPxxWA-CTERM sorting domain-containing protein n=1 Tax=Sphingomonas trueperi TaxID=53317 RepID=UPI000EB2E000